MKPAAHGDIRHAIGGDRLVKHARHGNAVGIQYLLECSDYVSEAHQLERADEMNVLVNESIDLDLAG